MKDFLKPVLVIFFGLLITLCSFKYPVFNIDESETVVVALKLGNAGMLADYFDARVEISLPDKSDNYSKNQAGMVVKDFFNNVEVKNFEFKHSDEKSGYTYCTGFLVTKKGKYRTTIFLKRKGDKELIQELAFLPER